jgi:predicted nucleotidyltransferase
MKHTKLYEEFVSEESNTRKSYPKEIADLIDALTSTMGYKKYELSFSKSINTIAGRYVIELPTTGFNIPQLKKLISILGSDMIVQYSPYTSHSGMIIKTDIKVQ